ncbi:MAG: BON domain-containing protein [Chromatiaceae bacterium]|nr:BON domain-containing protein [Gammaproteobacteria bacterium]MCP5298332.1 BON domain-containing protein [Chromatiaceae bacterium]MCP5423128.1 BON domain-containing protein [Chromatiaceae bacterium]
MAEDLFTIRNLFIAALALALSGCGPVIVGGAVTGAAVVHDRRTTGTVVEDQEIYLRAITMRSQNAELKQKSNINVDVYNLQVLLTGEAENAQIVEDFARQVAAIPRVRHVFNEVIIGAEATWTESTADAYLTSRVKVALFNVKLEGFDPTRVKVTSSAGSVYLMGLVTPQEGDAVTEEVRFVSGVKRVVKLFEYLE